MSSSNKAHAYEGTAYERDQKAKQSVRGNDTYDTQSAKQMKALENATRPNLRCCTLLRALPIRVPHRKRTPPPLKSRLRVRVYFRCDGCRRRGPSSPPEMTHESREQVNTPHGVREVNERHAGGTR